MRSIRFGPFEANLAARELSKNGVRLKLQDQPFRVLQALLEKPGEVVTREELQERIWGEDTYVDFDKSLSAAIGKVREALGDSRTRPRYIETIPKVGYRFVGEIETPATERLEQDQPHSSSRLHWAPAGVIAVALLAWFYVADRGPREPNGPLRGAPLTTYEGREGSATFSPDGSQIAFSWDKSDGEGPAIYVKSMGSEQPRLLQSSATNPAWSPDGELIAYIAKAEENGRCELRLVAPTGGAIRTAASLTCPQGNLNYYSPLSWSPNNRVVVYPDKRHAAEPWALQAVNVVTGETWVVSDPPPGIFGDTGPSFSRRGESLAFLRLRSSSHATEVRAIKLDSDLRPASPSTDLPLSSPRPLQRANSIVWSSDDRSFFISNGDALWKAHSRGGEAKQILALGGWLKADSLDTRNKRLALTQHRLDTDIWRLNRESGDSLPLITSTKYDSYHSISPDGERIAWTSDRSGHQEVWVCNADGSEQQQLTSLETKSGAPTWSPDGKWVVFDTRVNGSSDLYLIDSRGGPARPLLAGPEEDFQPTWSADGRTLYFSSLRGGAVGIWRVAIERSVTRPFEIEPGRIEPVVRQTGVVWCKVSPDGEFLFYRGGSDDPAESRRLYRKQLPDGDEVAVAENVEGFDSASSAVYFISSDKPAIWRLDSESGELQALLKLEEEGSRIAVSRDEGMILFTQDEPRQADLLLVEGIE